MSNYAKFNEWFPDQLSVIDLAWAAEEPIHKLIYILGGANVQDTHDLNCDVPHDVLSWGAFRLRSTCLNSDTEEFPELNEYERRLFKTYTKQASDGFNKLYHVMERRTFFQEAFKIFKIFYHTGDEDIWSFFKNHDTEAFWLFFKDFISLESAKTPEELAKPSNFDMPHILNEEITLITDRYI